LVAVNIDDNPLISAQGSSVGFLGSLIAKANNEEISVARLVMAGVLALSGIVLAGSLVYGAVKNSLISLGRNPLSRSYIYKGFTQTVAIALVILVVAGFIVYLLL